MERRPAELGRIAAVIFLLINFGVIISESLVIDDPTSTVICIANKTYYNRTFEKDIRAGIFTDLGKASSVPWCVRQACNRRAGDVAFVLGDVCYMVTCFSKTSCKIAKPDGPSGYSTSLTRYSWFDAAPVFTDFSNVLQVKENNQPGQIIKNIFGHARNRWNKNSSIKYNIIKGNTGNAFKLEPHPSGQSASLVASKRLDREAKSLYIITIQATNNDENKTTTKVILINVTDENDNPPVFSRHNYSVTIFSNRSIGSEVLRVNAKDADIGENARISFNLLNYRSLFRILPRSGTILLNQKIRVDRTTRPYELQVEARNGAHKSLTIVRVRVLPVNEYRPFFENLKYTIRVSEAIKTGNSVTRVLARDYDYGVNGELNFTIITGNKTYFRIDDDGVVRTRQSLLTLGGSNYTLTVVVSDKGTPPKRSLHVADVYITIEEIQKHKVKFDLPLYHVSIAEDTPVGTSILTVRAVTGMRRTRIHGTSQAERKLDRKSRKVVYSIGNPNGYRYFSIGKHTGEIKTKAAMDYEKVKSYRLVLFAKDTEKRDASGHPETDTSNVYVNVLDLNDNAPRFVMSPYQKIINESVSVDSVILGVTAMDRDTGTNGQVRYSIASGNFNDTFSLDNNGSLKVRRKLTRVPSDFFNLTIYATDLGTQPMNSTPVSVYIKVLRSSGRCTDRLLFPIAQYLANVNESAPVGTEILQVSATEGKCRYKGKITYYFTELRDPQVEKYFTLGPQTGIIKLITPLDFETRDRFPFEVGAVDTRNHESATARVRIQVLDVNDNKPYFLKQNYKEKLSTLPEPGTVVANVVAQDDDRGKNRELEYSLVSGGGGYFRVNSKSGAIRTLKRLNRENLGLFNITVSVMDHGTPPLKAVRQAHVSILIFTPLQSTLILMETKQTTITIRFNLKYLAPNNIAKYGVLVQEYSDDDPKFKEMTKKEPTTWYLVNKAATKEDSIYQRYITKVIPSSPAIRSARLLELTIGDEENCENKRGDEDYCNGPLQSGVKYRFQLRAYLKSTGPFKDVEFQENDFSDPHITAVPSQKAAYKKDGGSSYDAVVYAVGTCLVLVIMLAFLRGFYRLKLDRKSNPTKAEMGMKSYECTTNWIHEEKKKRISFPISNPRFQEPNSPVEKIRTPGPAKKMVAVNHDKGSEFSHRDEDEAGSSPDSALDESTRLTQPERRRPTLQEVRLKNYFNSVESSSCASCEHVRIYCVQETVT